ERVAQVLKCYNQILVSLRIIDGEIKNARAAIQENYDIIDGKLQDHNHGSLIFAARDKIKRDIREIRTKITSLHQKLIHLDNSNLIANDFFLEKQLPLILPDFKEKLASFVEEEKELISKYNTEALSIKTTRNELVLSATEQKN